MIIKNYLSLINKCQICNQNINLEVLFDTSYSYFGELEKFKIVLNEDLSVKWFNKNNKNYTYNTLSKISKYNGIKKCRIFADCQDNNHSFYSKTDINLDDSFNIILQNNSSFLSYYEKAKSFKAEFDMMKDNKIDLIYEDKIIFSYPTNSFKILMEKYKQLAAFA